MSTIALFLLLALIGAPASAHDLRHTVTQAGSVVIQLAYADETPFSFEGYEIYFADETIPFQVGRTDKLGRIAFVPDRTGTWRIKAVSEDGHGAEFSIEADAQGGALRADRSLFERYGRMVAGLAIIFGLFGLLQLFYRRRKA
jgi:nickel transport protein